MNVSVCLQNKSKQSHSESSRLDKCQCGLKPASVNNLSRPAAVQLCRSGLEFLISEFTTYVCLPILRRQGVGVAQVYRLLLDRTECVSGGGGGDGHIVEYLLASHSVDKTDVLLVPESGTNMERAHVLPSECPLNN
ncbi:hypothetical protein CBL_12863 [Carabus blaptoides fortunei]